ncbi:MAG: hypothetical protein OXH70_02770 [Acidobacteria bacterium]|nr:hypothetical protein [Acidobacteriota bacterium]
MTLEVRDGACMELRATRAAYALSLEATETTDIFAGVLGAAIEARDDLGGQAEAFRGRGGP